MSALWIATIGASAACFALKYLGYSIPQSLLENARFKRINNLIPVVLLSALVSVQTFTADSVVILDHRIVGVAVAALALKMRRSFPEMMLAAALSSALVYNLL